VIQELCPNFHFATVDGNILSRRYELCILIQPHQRRFEYLLPPLTNKTKSAIANFHALREAVQIYD